MAAGLAVIFLLGVTWLTVVTPLGFDGAIATGLAPFLPADILKVFLAGAILPAVWRITGRTQGS
jgi:biotin transport system substrate-specific component